MQPFTFESFRVGIRDSRMTAIAGRRFQALLGERPFTDADRSLDRKSAAGSFGSQSGTRRHSVNGCLLALTGRQCDSTIAPVFQAR